MPSHNGKQYRTHGQAYRASMQSGSQPPQDAVDNSKGGDAVDGKDSPKGKNIVAVKHSSGPPYQVKHEDGHITSHDSHEDLMSHLAEHIPGGESSGVENDGMDSDYGSEGSKEALDSLLG